MLKDETAYIEIKNYINNKSGENTWIRLSTKELQRDWKLSNYYSVKVLNELQIDPDIRYRLIKDISSRFPAREYLYGTPEDKLKDLDNDNLIKQFDMPLELSSYAIDKLSEYKTVDKLSLFYSIMIIVEKLYIKGLSKEWMEIDKSFLIRLFDCEYYHILYMVQILLDTGLLKKMPNSNKYYLALSAKTSQKIDEEISEYNLSAENKQLSTSDQVKLSKERIVFNPEDTVKLKEFKRSIKTMANHVTNLNKIVIDAVNACAELEKREEIYRNEKSAFFRLNEAYNEATRKIEILEKDKSELMKQIAMMDSLFDRRAKQAENDLDLMLSELTSVIENYNQLPLYKKNEISVSAKLKSDMLNIVVTAKNKAMKNLRAKEE